MKTIDGESSTYDTYNTLIRPYDLIKKRDWTWYFVNTYWEKCRYYYVQFSWLWLVEGMRRIVMMTCERSTLITGIALIWLPYWSLITAPRSARRPPMDGAGGPARFSAQAAASINQARGRTINTRNARTSSAQKKWMSFYDSNSFKCPAHEFIIFLMVHVALRE